jgi:anti-sigma B factor antagonist
MALNVTQEITNGISKITLSGRLDAATAQAFKIEVEKAAAEKAKTIVLLLSGLEYMASAGLRVLVFAKQKMGPAAKIYIVGAQDMVLQTIELSGFHQAVTILKEYDPAIIEKVSGK